MSSSTHAYDSSPPSAALVVKEEQIEYGFIGKLQNLKYEYRADIRDRASLEKNFREKFEALNRVTLTEAELPQLAAWLRPRLPGYLIPRHWLGWPAQEQSALKPGRRPLAAYAASRLDPTQAESKPTMPTD